MVNKRKKFSGPLVISVAITISLLYGVVPAKAAIFERPLGIGTQGADVSTLQKILKNLGFFTYPEITGYFGPITQEAVRAFQAKYSIVSSGTPTETGWGFVGLRTRAVLNELPFSSAGENLPSVITASAPNVPHFTRDLGYGMRGEDVRQLQRFLNSRGFFVAFEGAGSPGKETLNYLAATQAAVMRFQAAQGIYPVTGFFGLLSRIKVSDIIARETDSVIHKEKAPSTGTPLSFNGLFPLVPGNASSVSVPADNNPTPDSPEVVDVFIFAGQSNINTNSVTEVPVELQTPDANVKIWNIQTGAWETYEAGVNSMTVSADQTIFGPEGEFARLWRVANPSKTLYLIKYGQENSPLMQVDEVEGQPLSDWSPQSDGELFDLTKNEIGEALAAISADGKVGAIRAIFWMQGETDGFVIAEAALSYEENLTEFIAAARSEWQAPDAKFTIGRISTYPFWFLRSPVRLAQAKVADEDINVDIISTDAYGLQAGEPGHYNVEGVTSLGTDFYAAYAGTYSSSFDNVYTETLDEQASNTTATVVQVFRSDRFTATPGGVTTRAKVKITGPINRVFIGQQMWDADGVDAYDALSLTPVLFGGHPSVSQAVDASTWSDDTVFYWDGEARIIVSVEFNDTLVSIKSDVDGSVVELAYLTVDVLEADTADKTGYDQLEPLPTIFAVSGLQLNGF